MCKESDHDTISTRPNTQVRAARPHRPYRLQLRGHGPVELADAVDFWRACDLLLAGVGPVRPQSDSHRWTARRAGPSYALASPAARAVESHVARRTHKVCRRNANALRPFGLGRFCAAGRT